MEIVGEVLNVGIIVATKTEKSHELAIKFSNDKKYTNLTFSFARKEIRDEIFHASIQNLIVTSDGERQEFWLVGIVIKSKGANDKIEDKYSACLLLAQLSDDADERPKLVEQIQIVENQDKKLKVHLLSNFDKDGTHSESEDTCSQTFKNRLILLRLNECVMVYTIETLPFSSSQAHLEILSSECVTRSFWWAQWVPQHKFLAFAHTRKVQSSFDDDDDPLASQPKPVLSVLQFHDKYPHESVLNMPLKIESSPEEEALQVKSRLVHNTMILSSTGTGLKILAHSSGAVHLFHLHSSNIATSQQDRPVVSYSINLFHHNRHFRVDAKLCQNNFDLESLKVDVCLHSNGQYLVVVAWPFFVHLLDVGIVHEPSHHLIFDDLSMLMSTSLPFLSLCTSQDLQRSGPNGNDSVHFLFQDFSSKGIEFSSTVLLPLLKIKDINFKLAVLHLLLVHLGDINAAKRIIYDSAKNVENLHLKKIFQEFLVGYSYLQTKKQLATNLEPFLRLIPYCLHLQPQYFEDEKIIVKCVPNPAAVTTMLLSPSQRVFPHNITDVWTSLWEIHQELGSKHNRFIHQKIAEKVFLSLQCYKPEALSRFSSPTSPSSPMICASMGDIAGMFSRRLQELQLPFLEHEFCTANKQEYIFSINLRELSMHLLKERKEWPLHGHAVAVKYVNAMVDTARLLCHLICLTVQLQPTKNRDKGFRLMISMAQKKDSIISFRHAHLAHMGNKVTHLYDSLDWETKLKLFMLFEHYALAVGELACPLPQGFAPFFTYLGYRVVPFDQFYWHVRSGTFELQIDLVKLIMSDLNDSDEDSVGKKLHLISLLPRARASRVLSGWTHPKSICIRARQHASDLLSGVVISQMRKSAFVINRKKRGGDVSSKISTSSSALDMFFKLLTLKAGPELSDLGLLTEATLLSMEAERQTSHL